MGALLPWWILIAPVVLAIIDMMSSSKTSSMGTRQTNATQVRTTP